MVKRLGKRGPIPKPLSETIEASSVIVAESGCWIWMGAETKTGYGKIRIGSLVDGSRAVTLAHRASWLAFNGDIPNGAFVCHHCDVPLCVNPDHLFLGTHKDNMADMRRKNRQGGPQWTRDTHPATKLYEPELARIHEMAKTMLHREIAAWFGVARSTITRVLAESGQSSAPSSSSATSSQQEPTGSRRKRRAA